MQEKRVPLRKCIGCGEMIGKKGALRIVRNKEGEVSIDLTSKKPGRGAYICRDIQCLDAAQKSHKLERALKSAVSDEIYNAVAKEISDNG